MWGSRRVVLVHRERFQPLPLQTLFCKASEPSRRGQGKNWKWGCQETIWRIVFKMYFPLMEFSNSLTIWSRHFYNNIEKLNNEPLYCTEVEKYPGVNHWEARRRVDTAYSFWLYGEQGLEPYSNHRSLIPTAALPKRGQVINTERRGYIEPHTETHLHSQSTSARLPAIKELQVRRMSAKQEKAGIEWKRKRGKKKKKCKGRNGAASASGEGQIDTLTHITLPRTS